MAKGKQSGGKSKADPASSKLKTKLNKLKNVLRSSGTHAAERYASTYGIVSHLQAMPAYRAKMMNYAKSVM